MMVSTRGVRYKFSEGERVLCYEPDPTKAKVLYDSKVLEVIENKDKRGRRTIEYLIHFQGWNSSWDRCVSEDFVLKDTEENRQLQRDLAEKSQLQLGAYLYRRERKKGGSTSTGPTAAKRSRHGFSDDGDGDGSSSSTQPDAIEGGDTDFSSGEGSQSQSPPPGLSGRAQITLPSALRDRLTFDYHLVVKRGRLSKLPAVPCAAQILESFVKWFARAGAWHPSRARHDPPHRPDLLDVSCRLNLVREVADGLRVYFDFVLKGYLLYKQEMEQYHEMCGRFTDSTSDMKPDIGAKISWDDFSLNKSEQMLTSPKEYAHLPPDPFDLLKDENGAAPAESNNNNQDNSKGESKAKTETNDNHAPPPKKEEKPPIKRGGTLARRLRSHKSAVSQSENETEPAPSTSTGEPRTLETLSSSVGSSGSSLSEGWRVPPPAAAAAAPPATRTPLSLLLDKVSKWQIIPREGTEHLPCRVYGAIHLARLFVKLPDFLNATHVPDFKLKLILKHIDMFIQYLDEHSEWFGEIYYIADNSARHH